MQVRRIATLFTLFGAIAMGGQARAVSMASAPAACRDDVVKLCKSVTLAGGNVGKCLKDNTAKLSENCKAAVNGKKNEVGASLQACKEDKAKFCKDVKEGAGAVVNCLMANETLLSPACKAEAAKAKAAAKAP